MISAAAVLPADPPFNSDGVMDKPGFKVMHMQDIDYRMHLPAVRCLPAGSAEMVDRTSEAYSDLLILVETKQEKPRPGVQVTVPEPFTESTFDALDAEIRSDFFT